MAVCSRTAAEAQGKAVCVSPAHLDRDCVDQAVDHQRRDCPRDFVVTVPVRHLCRNRRPTPSDDAIAGGERNGTNGNRRARNKTTA